MWLTPENELIDISKSELFLARTIKERNKKDITLIERNERSDFGCLLKLWGTRVCLANFVSQSGFRKLAANQSQVEGNRGKLLGT